MDFRRIPFQFTSTDPAKRQAELQKRFGLPVNKEKGNMHIDFANPGFMGVRSDGMSSASNSPRLQHRVPIFKEGSPESMKSSVDSQGSPVAGRKPHVRVVPIEIEGDDNLTRRHRSFSGPPVEDHPRKNGTWLPEESAAFTPVFRTPAPDPKPSAPRERTIPIQVESVGPIKKAKTTPIKKEKSANLKVAAPKPNGCNVTKKDKAPSEPKKPLTGVELSLKKIEGVLEKLKTYHADVEKFNGTVKEKKYRYLDEMLTRLMLELDDIDTMGNEDVRLSRKAAVRKVQASVDLLEEKVTKGAPGQMPDEAAKGQDVEMEASSSQDENAMGTAGAMTDSDENKCQVEEEPIFTLVDQVEKTEDVEMENNVESGEMFTESASATVDQAVENEDVEMENNIQDREILQESASVMVDQAEKTQDEEMKNDIKDGEKLQESSSEITAVKENEEYQVMEVDVDIKTESEPVVVTPSSPKEKAEYSEQSVTIEEINSDSKDSEHVLLSGEPVVSFADSPVKELKNNLELDTAKVEDVVPSLNGEAEELKSESDILSDATNCVEELVTKSCCVGESGENISNLEKVSSIPSEHSKNVNTELS